MQLPLSSPQTSAAIDMDRTEGTFFVWKGNSLVLAPKNHIFEGRAVSTCFNISRLSTFHETINHFGHLIAASTVFSGSATAVVRTTRTFISFSLLWLLFAAKLHQAKLNLDALRERVQAPAFGRGSNLTVG